MSVSESDVDSDTGGPRGGQQQAVGLSNEELEVQLELLREENHRLRTLLGSARRNQYRRTAIGLAAIGAIALVGAVVFIDYRAVLLSLAATGFFTAVLTVYLTPEEFIAASTGEAVYDALATNQVQLVDELELEDTCVYMPTMDTPDFNAGTEPVRLFVPKWPEYELPEPGELSTVITVTTNEQTRGLSLRPTGGPLLREYAMSSSVGLAGSPAEIGHQLANALVEQFELAGQAESQVDNSEQRLAISIEDSTFGDVTRFDHPVASFVASGLAAAISRPVVCHVREDDEPGQYVVVCHWDDSEAATD